MNLRRKNEMQERHITHLQCQIEKLEKENDSLRSANQELLDKIDQYQLLLRDADEARCRFTDMINELNKAKEQYKQMIYEARKTKEDYDKKTKEIIGQIRSAKLVSR